MIDILIKRSKKRVNARIISIEKNRALVALMNEKGSCASGGCGGCSCSSRIKTMRIDLPENESWKEGDTLSLVSHGAVFDALLLIVFPAAAAVILTMTGLSVPLVLLSSALIFCLAALSLRFFRGKKKLEILRL